MGRFDVYLANEENPTSFLRFVKGRLEQKWIGRKQYEEFEEWREVPDATPSTERQEPKE